jgi:hypothetical protein
MSGVPCGIVYILVRLLFGEEGEGSSGKRLILIFSGVVVY